MRSNDYLADLVPRLTVNGAINLRSTVIDPCPLNPNSIHGKGRTFTGMGKWTTIAAIGIEKHLISLGLAEMTETGTYWNDAREPHHKNKRCLLTPLGREMAAYLNAHWNELCGQFRDPPKREWYR